MPMKILLASILGWAVSLYALGAAAWQAPEVQECPQSQQNKFWLDCSTPDIPARLPYKMDNGQIQILETREVVFCKQGVCEYQGQNPSGLYYSTGEYAGQIKQQDKTPIVLVRGYYLGNAKDNRIVAYLKGTGPENGGEMAAALKVADSPDEQDDPEVSACVDKWAAVFRKQNGQEAPIIYDALEEWAHRCKEGKEP
ncbi:hypothetical protein [Pseudomonas pseudonitroreducens]|uniref:hypothetical protein n=1 Tax=Pseudomonas pseudonitroreducens TaxID=2892326 RepID=UPI001F2338FC|nr:hypothetical protein [Pseudomonas pseudonitroreducens]